VRVLASKVSSRHFYQLYANKEAAFLERTAA